MSTSNSSSPDSSPTSSLSGGSPVVAENLVNLSRYPIATTASAAALDRQKHFFAACRETYHQTGLCALPEFIVPGVQGLMAEQASQAAHHAFFCSATHNAYLTDVNDQLPDDDVARRQEQTTVGSIPYDRIGQDTLLQRLYSWDPLREFIRQVLGKTVLHRFADPLGACSINVFVDGGEHGWHFDESEFTVTLMLQAPQTGGAFEYVPMIRGSDNEREIVDRVLDGDRASDLHRVEELPFTAGTLLIFGGRQTLHRVTKVQGERPRLVPVLCFSEQADDVNSEHVRELFWGRTGSGSAA